MTTYERIEFLIKKHNLNINKLEKGAGLPTASVAKWRDGKIKPSANALKKIADFFDVSIDFLLGQEKSPSDNSVGFSRFSEILASRGLTEQDIENLSTDKLAAIAEIVKNFQQ